MKNVQISDCLKNEQQTSRRLHTTITNKHSSNSQIRILAVSILNTSNTAWGRAQCRWIMENQLNESRRIAPARVVSSRIHFSFWRQAFMTRIGAHVRAPESDLYATRTRVHSYMCIWAYASMWMCDCVCVCARRRFSTMAELCVTAAYKCVMRYWHSVVLLGFKCAWKLGFCSFGRVVWLLVLRWFCRIFFFKYCNLDVFQNIFLELMIDVRWSVLCNPKIRKREMKRFHTNRTYKKLQFLHPEKLIR